MRRLAQSPRILAASSRTQNIRLRLDSIDDDGWSITRLHTLRDETTDPHELGGSAVLRSHFDALRRGRSTNSAASSASLRSVLRGVPICARMVSPRAKSVT